MVNLILQRLRIAELVDGTRALVNGALPRG